MRCRRRSFNLAPVTLHRLVGLGLVAVVLALAPAAYASPPDDSSLAGLYDNADFDDVVLFITSSFGVIESRALGSLRSLLSVVGLATPMASEPGPLFPLLSVVGRAPPLA